jgi:nucleoside-diphosphate-sugar epimerase
MEETGVKKLIFYSTVAVYGDSDVPTYEEMEARPGNPYGRSKLAAESWVRKWTEADPERSSIIIRPTVVFGPHNRGNIYRLIRQIYRRAYLPVGRGDNIKSIACVENLVAATLFLMKKRINGCEIFNYTDAPHLPYREIVALIYKGLGRKPPTYYLPVNPMVQVASIADKIIAKAGIAFSLKTALLKISKTTHHLSDKIRSLGFVPQYSSTEGLQRMTKWYLDDLKKNK